MSNIQDPNNNPIEVSSINNNIKLPYYIQSIVEIKSIWIKNNVFGLSLLYHKLKISYHQIPITIINTYSNIDDSCDEDSENLEYNNILNKIITK